MIGRSCLLSDVCLTGLAMYFVADESFDVGLVRAFLRRLHNIESWFAAQSSYHFIASSLLFIYSADALRHGPPHNSDHQSDVSDHLADGSDHLTDGSDHLTDGLSSVHDCGSAGVESCVDERSNGCNDLWWDHHIDLKMIDFTHAFSVSSTDDNYLTGLRSMISYLCRLRRGMYSVES